MLKITCKLIFWRYSKNCRLLIALCNSLLFSENVCTYKPSTYLCTYKPTNTYLTSNPPPQKKKRKKTTTFFPKHITFYLKAKTTLLKKKSNYPGFRSILSDDRNTSHRWTLNQDFLFHEIYTWYVSNTSKILSRWLIIPSELYRVNIEVNSFSLIRVS